MAIHTKCPTCGAGGVKCHDSRNSSQLGVLRRRNYNCPSCSARFYTDEVIRRVGDDELLPDSRATALKFVDAVHRLAQETFGNENGTLAHPGKRFSDASAHVCDQIGGGK